MMERGRKGRLLTLFLGGHFLPEGGRAFYCLFKLFEQFFGRILLTTARGHANYCKQNLLIRVKGTVFRE